MSIYKKIYVIGTGAVANSCALCVKKAGEVVELIESRPATVPTCKQFCEKQGIAYQQLSGDVLKEFLLTLNEPTLIISAANRYLFPKEVVEKNNITIVNYHGALLPKHPGRNAEAWAIYEGDKEAGITWHYVVSDVDAGSILIQKTTPITEQTTSFTLLRINSKLVMEGFEKILPGLLTGNLTGTKQTERHDIHYSWMKPNDGILDLNWDGAKISAFLRAFDYGPLRTMGYPKVAVGGKEYEILSYKELMNLDKDSHNTIQINTEKSQLMIQRENKEFDMLVAETNCQIISELNGGGVTNCYLLQNELGALSKEGVLHCYNSGNNVVLLQDRANSRRLYYYINDFDSIIELPEDSDYLCEVIYRGEKIPEKEIEYLQKLGFVKNAVRSIYQLLYKEATPYTMRSGCEIRFAYSLDEVEEACQLFNATFDNISGDFISPDEYESLLTGKAITMAIDENGNMAGAFHHDCEKNVAWGRHFAVKGEYRGRSVGKDLLYDFIERYHLQGSNRYMLWCLIDNAAAVRMYESTGFKTIGRNCISMVKNSNIK